MCLTRQLRLTVILLFGCFSFASAYGDPKAKPLGEVGSIKARHIDQIVEYLDESPAGFGKPISDRTTWDELAKKDAFHSYITQAEKYLTEPVPELTEEMYLDYFKTGRRGRWATPAHWRRHRAYTYALAECLENKGRFIGPFCDIVRTICSEPTWIMPAHDNDQPDNYYGRDVKIALYSAEWGWQLATCDFLLADKIDPDTRKLIRQKLHERILDPVRNMILGNRHENSWMRKESNWNPVCWAGVTGTALGILDSKWDRAFYIEAARSYSKNYLDGFTSDGYCTEGVGYWNYGFGHYVMLAEMLYQATHGKIDLFDVPAAQQPAMYPARIEIINDIYPNFADCGMDAKPHPALMNFISRRFQLGLTKWENDNASLDFHPTFPTNLVFALPNSADQTPPAMEQYAGPGIRSWFDKAGILIVRPQENSPCQMAAAIKGGNNGEKHNHNDVGSFILVIDRSVLLVDPGPESYTKRTFSSDRYVSNVLNSYGHSTPLPADTKQSTGQQAYAKVISLNFSDNVDTITFDLKNAYDVPELLVLNLTFTYNRTNAPSLTITDEVRYTSPKAFEAALITLSSFKQIDADTLQITDDKETVLIKIDTHGQPFEIRSEQINEETHLKPTRLSIRLAEPVTNALITTTITPMNTPTQK